MKIYKKYLAFNLLMPVGMVVLTLTGIIWLSQSLRFIDLIVNKGLDVGTFLYLSMLLVPSLLIIILPVSLFVSVLYLYNKLTSESELLVFKSAGISRIGLASPAILIAGLVTVINYFISFYILPVSYREFKDMQDFIRNNYASTLLQEGVFSTPVDKLTVYIEARDNDGNLRGILVHDARNSERPTTMMAQEGFLQQTTSGPRFQLINGNRQEINRKNNSLSLLYFDSYPLDLSVYTKAQEKRFRVAEERYINELLFPNETDQKINTKLIAEGHHRISWPFFSITLALIAVTTLFSGQLNRRGQWKRVLSATVIALVLLISDLGLKNITLNNNYVAIIMYANTVLPSVICIYILIANRGADHMYKIRKLFSFISSLVKSRGRLQ